MSEPCEKPSLMPRSPFKGATTHNYTMGHLYLNFEDDDPARLLNDQADRQVCGFPLPPWQRPLVWEQEQCIRFIESAWLGLSLGTYVVNRAGNSERDPISNILIDGQQRLHALERYWSDEFPVFGYHWSELPIKEQRSFRMSVVFPQVEVTINDEAQLRDLYDRLNFGGTAHTEDQRATVTPTGGGVNPAPSTQVSATSYQARVNGWMQDCFGPVVARDCSERNYRFLEEALELVQACGCTRDEAHQLVDYVFFRPIGEKAQEVGGVCVTLAALCEAQGIDMKAAGEAELARVWTKIDAIRAKQARKPKHSPLPGLVRKKR